MKSFACIFALTLLAVATAAPAATKPAGTTVADSKGEFTITIPPAWKQGTLNRDGLRVMGPPPAGTRAYPMFQAQRGLQPDAAERPYVIAINNGQLFVLNSMQEQAHYDVPAAKGVIDSFRWSR
jgi:hypothetical protein